jgi:hypothetical protein
MIKGWRESKVQIPRQQSRGAGLVLTVACLLDHRSSVVLAQALSPVLDCTVEYTALLRGSSH